MATGVAPGPMGSAHPLNAPYEAFETADGWITIGAANQTNWLRLRVAVRAGHQQVIALLARHLVDAADQFGKDDAVVGDAGTLQLAGLRCRLDRAVALFAVHGLTIR